jgi:hypothetical protein
MEALAELYHFSHDFEREEHYLRESLAVAYEARGQEASTLFVRGKLLAFLEWRVAKERVERN